MDEQPECLACRTAAGAFAAEEVYRDDQVVAVTAHHAMNRGHLVVVTRAHVRNALDMPDDLLCHTLLVGKRLGNQLRAATGCAGIMLVFNNEEPCQTLFHTHLHVIPREWGDEMDRKFGAYVEQPDREQVAAELRRAFEAE